MKLCFLLGGNEEGGLENHVITLCNRFSTLYSVTLIAHPKYSNRLDKNVHFIALPLGLSRRNPWLLLKLILRLRQVKPDLIHAHGNKAAALLATVKSWVSGCCIATVHSQKRKTGMFERMDGVIGVSAGVLEPIKHPIKRLIYNGVDIYDGPVYTRESLLKEWGFPEDRPLCFAVGRLVPVKAYDMLIRAWQSQPGYLALIGEGTEQSRLQGIIDELDLADRVKLVGARPDVRSLLPAADLLVISSEREGFSLVLVEALLAQVPVLSTRVAGSREVLPEVCLCDCGDEAALENLIKRSLDDIDNMVRQCQLVFSLAQQSLTTDAMLAQTDQFYREMMSVK